MELCNEVPGTGCKERKKFGHLCADGSIILKWVSIEMVGQYIDSIHLEEERTQWRAHMKTTIDLRVMIN
jgi:hypothetical protein